MLLAVGGLTLGVVLALGVFLFAVPSLEEKGQIENNLGDDVFELSIGEDLADEIAERGPLILADVAGGDRDIVVQHLGDDPAEGWFVFAVRPPDAGRDCQVEWDADADLFTHSCDDRTFPADGEGLKQYPVEIDEEEEVLTVDLNFEDRPAETTTTLRITGAPTTD